MYTYFKDLNTTPHENTSDHDLNSVEPNIIDNNTETTLNSPITRDEIDKMINKCKNGKTCSQADNICNIYIKATKTLMLPIYTILFNMIFDSGTIPDTWSKGYIFPIYKGKGPRDSPENYRPITILSCLGKLFTSVLNERLTRYSNENYIINQNQAGFRKNFSTTDNIFCLNFLINNMKKLKSKLFVGFVDFTKCFDLIPRAELFHKLNNNNVQGKLIRIIKNMYDNIKSCVQTKYDYSAIFACDQGVRQGDNLSPLLFSYYLNDLLEHLKNNNNKGIQIHYQDGETMHFLALIAIMFADDTIL